VNKKPEIIFFILTVFPLYFIGQVITLSSTITDIKGEPLQLSNIMTLNNSFGTTSDENGYFEITIPDSLKYDTLVVSYVGYYSKYICISDLKDKIILKPQVFQLPEVYIKTGNVKSSKPLFINKFKKKKCFLRYTKYDSVNNNLWVPFRPNEPAIEAISFPDNSKDYKGKKLKEVRVYLTTFKTPATFRLRIYSADKKMEPGPDLLKIPLTADVVKNNSLITINLEKYNLIFPENGIFVGVELLIIMKNKTTLNKDGNEYTVYSPFLNFIKTYEKGRFWQYSEGKWTQNNSTAPVFTKGKRVLYYKPAITLVLDE
jgi:hypothetical protein